MKWNIYSAVTLLLFSSVSAYAQEATRVKVELDPATASKTFEDSIEGYASFDYVVSAEAGQQLAVSFRSTNMGAYIDIFPPGSDDAMHVGARRGNRFEGTLPESGDYRVHVFMMDNAAHRDEIAEFTIELALRGIEPDYADGLTDGPPMTAGSSGTTIRVSDDPNGPELFVRASGEIEVNFKSGCGALYGSDGTKITSGSSCSAEHLRQAAEAVADYRRRTPRNKK